MTTAGTLVVTAPGFNCPELLIIVTVHACAPTTSAALIAKAYSVRRIISSFAACQALSCRALWASKSRQRANSPTATFVPNAVQLRGFHAISYQLWNNPRGEATDALFCVPGVFVCLLGATSARPLAMGERRAVCGLGGDTLPIGGNPVGLVAGDWAYRVWGSSAGSEALPCARSTDSICPLRSL